MADAHGAGHPFVTPQRERLAEAVRHLVDATLTIEDATEEQLGTAADMAEAVARHLGRQPHDDDRGVRGRSEDGHSDYLCRSPLVGVVSPVAPPMTWTTDDDGLRMRGTFHAAYEGPPGYVHGGMIALAFDEVLGIANIAAGHPGMTARLTIHYRKPTPLFHELRFRAALDRVEGRRIMSRAQLWDGETLTAEAEGLFVQPRPERALEIFGPPD